jgi:hypothetical protein
MSQQAFFRKEWISYHPYPRWFLACLAALGLAKRTISCDEAGRLRACVEAFHWRGKVYITQVDTLDYGAHQGVA